MTIRGVELRNIESHKSTNLWFSDGVNIITGLSGHGKSAIIRGIILALYNSPLGNNMINHDADGDTVAAIEFDDESYIVLNHTGTNRSYDVSTVGHPLTALKGKVPIQVRNLANMDMGINVQRQRDFYFMLMDSPSRVAKAFNKVSGLDNINVVLDEINKRCRACKKVENALEFNFKKLDEKVSDLEWILEADKEYRKIEKIYKVVDEITEEEESIEKIINLVNQINEQISKIGDTTAIPLIDEILSVEDDIYGIEESVEDVENLLESISGIEKEIKGIILPDSNEIEEMEVILKQMIDISEQQRLLKALSKSAEEGSTALRSLGKSMLILADAYKKELSKLKICPTCNRPLK